MYQHLMNSQSKDKTTYALTEKFYTHPDKIQVFIHQDNEASANIYNTCVEACSKNIKEARFELEY